MSRSVDRSGGGQASNNVCPTPSHEPGGNAGDIWLYTPVAGDRVGGAMARAQDLIGNRNPRGQSYSHASLNVTDSVVFSDDHRGIHFESQAAVIERASTTDPRRIDIMRPMPGGFDSKDIQADKSWTYTFRKTGDFAYICTFHPTMMAMVRVK